MSVRNDSQLKCAVCESSELEVTMEVQQFAYRDGERDVLLTASLPIEHCLTCGESLMGEAAEVAQHDAVCRYLGRLTPSEIKEIRSNLGISQSMFSVYTKISSASIKRWELGNQIQSEAMDALLRRHMDGVNEASVKVFLPVFRTEIKQHMIADAKNFELRPVW